jgi:hypothetical protein
MASPWRLAAPPDSAQPSSMERKLMPDWQVTPAYGPDLTFGRIAINEGALCIECKTCRLRSRCSVVSPDVNDAEHLRSNSAMRWIVGPIKNEKTQNWGCATVLQTQDTKLDWALTIAHAIWLFADVA